MDGSSSLEASIELLQELGLKEYEARSFVALSRLSDGTAKEISDVSEVPRTRVYDAVRVLESKGLVVIQHSNPQVFRAVPIEEAIGTLREEYESRMETLRETLEDVEPVQGASDGEVVHEVWSLAGPAAIRNRTISLVDEATSEVVLVLGHETTLDDDLVGRLRDATERGVDVVVGTVDAPLRETVESELPEAEVFVSGLEWLAGSPNGSDETVITRLLLVDRGAILVSSFEDGARDHERAVFGRGFGNGFVTLARRLFASGLVAPVES